MACLDCRGVFMAQASIVSDIVCPICKSHTTAVAKDQV